MAFTERARCMRLNATLPKSFWAEVINMASYMIIRLPWKTLEGKVVEKVCTGKLVDYSSLRVFGCPAYLHISSAYGSKPDFKLRKCSFVGYEKRVKEYKF